MEGLRVYLRGEWVGIAWPGFRQRIQNLHNRLTENLAHVHEDVSSIHPSMADAIRDRVELQLKRLKV